MLGNRLYPYPQVYCHSSIKVSAGVFMALNTPSSCSVLCISSQEHLPAPVLDSPRDAGGGGKQRAFGADEVPVHHLRRQLPARLA